jgi:HEPN domain-containing protein
VARKEVDQYYITNRWPDALPGGAPFATFTERQARSRFQISPI